MEGGDTSAPRDCPSPGVQKTPTHTVSGVAAFAPRLLLRCVTVSLCRSRAPLVLCLSLQAGQPRTTRVTLSLGRQMPTASWLDRRLLPSPPRSCIPRLSPRLRSTTPRPPTFTHPRCSLRVLPSAARGRCFPTRLRANHSRRLHLDRLLSLSSAHRALRRPLLHHRHHQPLQPISPAPAPRPQDLSLGSNLRSRLRTLQDLSQ